MFRTKTPIIGALSFFHAADGIKNVFYRNRVGTAVAIAITVVVDGEFVVLGRETFIQFFNFCLIVWLGIAEKPLPEFFGDVFFGRAAVNYRCVMRLDVLL